MKLFLCFLIFCVGWKTFCLSSSSSQKRKKLHSSSKKTHRPIVDILELSLERRLSILQKHPKKYFRQLHTIFQSENHSLALKWKALMAMARLNPQKARPYIIQSLKRRSWYFKNAGLIAMEIIDPQGALPYAGKFLNHPSLVLRTAAVEVIRRQKALQYKPMLKRQLHAKQNFRQGQSLWIRPRITETLAEFASTKDKQFFLSLLTDPDSQVQPIALKTLKKLTSKAPQQPRIKVAREGFEPPTHGL